MVDAGLPGAISSEQDGQRCKLNRSRIAPRLEVFESESPQHDGEPSQSTPIPTWALGHSIHSFDAVPALGTGWAVRVSPLNRG